MLPASTMTGIFCFRASSKIPEGTFPITVCRSARPSPVKIRSAPVILLPKSSTSSIRRIPGFNSAFRNARKPPPIPPAAPAPGISEMSLPVVDRITRESACILVSSSLTILASAPFCEAKTEAAPSDPQKGLRTSQAIVKRASFKAGCTADVSMEATCDMILPPVPNRFPRLSRKRNPKACSIPNPASLVALPPMPTIKWRQPCSRASRISSPVP